MKISSACLSVLKNFDNSEVNSVFLVSSKSLLLDEAKIGYMEGARINFFIDYHLMQYNLQKLD